MGRTPRAFTVAFKKQVPKCWWKRQPLNLLRAEIMALIENGMSRPSSIIILYNLTHLILITILWSRYYHHAPPPCFFFPRWWEKWSAGMSDNLHETAPHVILRPNQDSSHNRPYKEHKFNTALRKAKKRKRTTSADVCTVFFVIIHH